MNKLFDRRGKFSSECDVLHTRLRARSTILRRGSPGCGSWNAPLKWVVLFGFVETAKRRQTCRLG